MGNRLTRILRHRWFDEADVRRALPAQALAGIEARVSASERLHGGEIRVCIEAGLPLSYLWRGLAARDRAVMLFGKLRVWDTDRNNGVLIYLLLAERSVEIVADRGLNAHVDAAGWKHIIDGMRADLAEGRFESGLERAVDEVDALLRRHFPASPGRSDSNELPDKPVVM